MKPSIIASLASVVALSLTACNEDGQSTTVSQSLWSKDTIVSSSAADGTFTRIQYGSDMWGNSETVVSRGHSNATEQGDILVKGLELAVGLAVELSK